MSASHPTTTTAATPAASTVKPTELTEAQKAEREKRDKEAALYAEIARAVAEEELGKAYTYNKAPINQVMGAQPELLDNPKDETLAKASSDSTNKSLLADNQDYSRNGLIVHYQNGTVTAVTKSSNIKETYVLMLDILRDQGAKTVTLSFDSQQDNKKGHVTIDKLNTFLLVAESKGLAVTDFNNDPAIKQFLNELMQPSWVDDNVKKRDVSPAYEKLMKRWREVNANAILFQQRHLLYAGPPKDTSKSSMSQGKGEFATSLESISIESKIISESSEPTKKDYIDNVLFKGRSFTDTDQTALKKQAAQLDKEFKTIQEEVKTLETQVKEISDKLTQSSVSTSSEENSDLKAKAKESAAELETKKADLEAKQTELTTVKTELNTNNSKTTDSIEAQVKEIERRMEQLEKTQAKLEDHKNSMGHLLSNMDSNLDKVGKMLQDDEYQKLKDALYKEMESENKELQQRLAICKAEIDKLSKDKDVSSQDKRHLDTLKEKIEGKDKTPGLEGRQKDNATKVGETKKEEQGWRNANLQHYKDARKEQEKEKTHAGVRKPGK